MELAVRCLLLFLIIFLAPLGDLPPDTFKRVIELPPSILLLNEIFKYIICFGCCSYLVTKVFEGRMMMTSIFVDLLMNKYCFIMFTQTLLKGKSSTGLPTSCIVEHATPLQTHRLQVLLGFLL